LHNFIVNYRINATENEEREDDSVHYTLECLSFLINNPDICVGVYGNGCMGSANSRGRPTLDEKKLREAGMKLRDHLRDRLCDSGLQRVTGTCNVDYCHHILDNS
jgi:hypothetical protein